MTVILQALKPLTYASRRVPAGEVFDVIGETDARLLCAIGLATRHVQPPPAQPELPPVVVKKPRTYRKQTMEAEVPADPVTEVVIQAEPEEERPRRRYQRRDLTGAEE